MAIERSAIDIMEDMVFHVQSLFRSELRLAKAEFSEQVSAAVRGSGLLAAGLVFCLFALGLFLAAAVMALSYAVVMWLAAVIVGVGVLIPAVIMLVVGRQKLRHVHFKPERTIQTTKETIEWAKHPGVSNASKLR